MAFLSFWPEKVCKGRVSLLNTDTRAIFAYLRPVKPRLSFPEITPPSKKSILILKRRNLKVSFPGLRKEKNSILKI